MKSIQGLLLVGALTILPAAAQADRYFDCGHGHFSREHWSDDGWNREKAIPRFGGHLNNSRIGNSNADAMIRSGIQSGRLSQAEVRELKEKERNLFFEERSKWADGTLSKNERKDLRGDYKDFYKDLNHELNDGERASYPGFYRWR